MHQFIVEAIVHQYQADMRTFAAQQRLTRARGTAPARRDDTEAEPAICAGGRIGVKSSVVVALVYRWLSRLGQMRAAPAVSRATRPAPDQ
jgi:hypothetical protein